MIEINNLTFCYEGRKEDALHNVNLSIKQGECVVLSGGSGSGKTSITRVINGLIPHFYPGELSGNIEIEGVDINKLKPHELTETVGSVFQNPRTQFFSTDTDSELVFAMENCGYNRNDMQDRYNKTVQDLGLAPLCGRDIVVLSGGEKQRIALGGVYALCPDIYVLDEPSANLDIDGVTMLAETIGKLKEQGKSIVIAEHRLYYLKDIADRVVMMEDGKIIREFDMDILKKLSDAELHDMGLRTLDNKRTTLPHSEKSENGTVLEISGLSASYDSHDVFENFGLSVQKGEIVGIVGENGRGKSTLINVVCGAKKEKNGIILFNGRQVKAKHRNREAYLVMQDPNYQLFCDSVYSELKLARCGDAFSDDEIDNVLDMLNLRELKDFHPLSLSGGQKQRLAVGVAFLNKANIVMFDEPTSGLDYSNMLHVSAVIKQLSNNGKTVLVISHDDEFLSEVCSQIVKM